MKLNVLFTFLLFFLFLMAYSQDEPLTKITATPSKEIYDLLEDSKGFIWVADNLGVRRFDGVSFTNFTHHSQSSISMSGLCEDKLGRIWCHNFSGQIFYIDHEKMHLLEGYEYNLERNFPRMALCADQLIATSSKGLFTCNIETLQCKYISLPSGTTSLSVIGSKAVLFGESKCYLYQKEKGVVPLQINTERFTVPNLSGIVLTPQTHDSLIYAIINPGTQLYTFSIVNNQLQLKNIDQYDAFINTISVKKNEVWLHTKSQSVSLVTKEVIKGWNLSSMLKDKQGNKWFSSLDKGLIVQYAAEKWSTIKNQSLSAGDFIRCMKQGKNYFVWGSQQGTILVNDSLLNTTTQYKLPARAGAVENIQLIGKDSFFIAASEGLYLLHPFTRTFYCLDINDFARDIAVVDRNIYIATPRGLLRPNIDLTKESALSATLGDELFKKKQRCRAVRYDSSSGSLFIAYSDGLYQLQNNQLSPVLYNGEPIYASSLEYSNGNIYMGTFGGDFIIIKNKSLKKYKLENRSVSNAVLRMKLCDHHLWILKTSGVNVFDINSKNFIHNREMAYLNGSDIYDLEETTEAVYFSTAESLYKIQMQGKATLQPPSLYLLYLTINNRDTIFNNHIKLSPDSGNLSFYLAVPWLYKSSSVSIRYSIANVDKQNSDSVQWDYLEPNERIIQFNSLQSGSYTLQIEAGINGDFQYSVSRINYAFTIRKQWYSHWWFYLLLLAFMVLLFISFYKYRIHQLSKIEKLRRQISSDLHDDIGSTISSINIYSQLIKRGQNPFDYIDIIQANTVQVINNLDDVVWNINPKNDTIAQLISRMKLFALPYLQDNNIECLFDIEKEKDTITLSPEVRTDCYLIFKEAINNMVKHANCTTCHIYLYQKRKELQLTVKDNGKGFCVNMAALHRNGLTTMQLRAKQLKGKLTINSSPGNGTEIILTCRM